MRSLRFSALCMFSGFTLVTMAAPARAEGNGGHRLIWKQIAGILAPGSLVGRRLDGSCDVGVDCVAGTPAPWTAADGRAELDLEHGRLEFYVKGLVVAGDPTFANLGTTSIVTMVRGTLVCNDTEPGLPELVDTDAVPLSALGNAKFRGRVDLPASCLNEPGDIVFLVRIADVSDPSRAFLIDGWNAFGAVRTSRDDD